jgi:putative spermidine/putrescine transport system ATP-binding protein
MTRWPSCRFTNMSIKATAYPLTLDAIVQRYPGAPSPAVDTVTLEIAGGELVALLGPSGCGKTTLLRIIAGFIEQTEGKVVVGNKRIDDLPPNKREVGIVFQNYALFPHMTVADNVAYGLAARGEPQAVQRERVAEMLALVQMAHLADRYPRQMSGGQQQRVALARALAVRPRILLLDEPFAALDKNLRLDMQIEVKRIQRRAGITCILVTHDQEEAMSMADRVAVLNHGRLEQFASPTEIYDRPATLFVNRFVGTANLLTGTLVAAAGEQGRVALATGIEWPVRIPGRKLAAGSAVQVCVRPEQLRLVDTGDGLTGTIELSMPLGAQIVHEIRLTAGTAIKVVEARAAGARQHTPGTAIGLVPADGALVTVFELPAGSTASTPDPVSAT